MFDLESHLSNIFKNNNIKNVLDLGAGTGHYSVYSASYGAEVTAVDNSKMKGYIYPIHLLKHPKISFIKEDISQFLKQRKEKNHKFYDLIILFNVIVFLKKEDFLKNITNILNLLNNNGTLAISFFFADDETMSQNKELSFYDFKDFILPQGYKIIKKENKFVEEIHKPYGQHKHHIGYIEIKKNIKPYNI